jgi:hypothetical protein
MVCHKLTSKKKPDVNTSGNTHSGKTFLTHNSMSKKE